MLALNIKMTEIFINNAIFSLFLWFWLHREECLSDGWQILLECEIKSIDKHVWDDSSLVFSIKNDSATSLVYIICKIVAFHYSKGAVILVSFGLLKHIAMILLLKLCDETLNVSFVFLSASDFETWFEEFDHRLQNEILNRFKIS